MKQGAGKLLFFLKQLAKMGVQLVFLPLAYRCFCIRNRSVDENLVVFADAHNTSVPSSMKPVRSAMEGSGYVICDFFVDFGKLSFFRLIKNMLRFMELYSRARCVFICDNFLPVASCKKRKETVVVQLWHGGGALKKIGYDTTGDIPAYYIGNVYRNYDILTASAPMCREVFVGAMRIDEAAVRPTGLARTDCFYDDAFKEGCRQKFYRQYPDAVGKKVVLWAPTFRGNLMNPYVPEIESVKGLQEALGDEYKVIIKLHPHMNQVSGIEPCTMSAEELIVVTDHLVTDYSSILFDYLLFERPFTFFVPDIEAYRKERGFYRDPEKDFPANAVRNPDNLADSIREEWSVDRRRQLAECRAYYMGSCDGHAVERIIKEAGLCTGKGM